MVSRAIGHEACRAGFQVLFRTTQKLLSEVLSDSAERAQRMLRRAVAADLLILDDFAFRTLDHQEADMLYGLAEERLGCSATLLTSNRPPDDWYVTFPDPIVGGAIFDRMVSSTIKVVTTPGKSVPPRGHGSASDLRVAHRAIKSKHDSTIRPSRISVTAFSQATRFQNLSLYCGRNSPRAALGNSTAPRQG